MLRRRVSLWKLFVFGILGLSLVVIYLQGQVSVVQQEEYLLGTYFRIKAQGRVRERVVAALEAAWREARRLSEELSRTGPGPLGELNRRGSEEPVKLTPDLLALLEAARQFRALSHGAFDPTIGKIVNLWGFTQDWDRAGVGRVPAREELEPFLVERDFFIDTLAQTGRLSGPHVEIDLGGIAKGYIVDRVIGVLRSYELDNALVDAGGNIRVFNDRPRRVLWWEERRPFRIAVQHPRDEQKILGVLEIWADQAVATSGDYQRCFFADALQRIFPCRYADDPDKTRYHHLMDPKTGQPARGLISATILAPTAMEADALSTAVFVLGEREGLALVESLPKVEGVLVTDDGRIVTSSGIEAGRFPSELKAVR
ncbi:MAG: FAD:protein FMN transferase [Candidatus Bipolaricaulota bacterium]|nr:FAD:protein FMN transferase [Candidatus Bipolaricaulota bacterium]MCS7274278.1 FAD:protein FMN transferase [Candidatus Bipolaricaulota bacterium]MDW8111471.1 FAD:protein FMN transferase [Candidatus Bipolaricaulota bacterium]MDW8329386.1 FAD:protein FMN transferase [Candidatus Bipolaricaulota bacterium]